MTKYLKITVITILSTSLLTCCQTELDEYNRNPNNPAETNPSLLLAAMEIATFQTHTSGLVRNAGIFTQHLAGTNLGQMGEIARYIVVENDVNNEWNSLYQTTLMNGHLLNRNFAKNYPYYNGIGQILTALNLGYATDMWGDIPYDNAFLAEQGSLNPTYNTQKEIYERMQTLLDKAVINLSQPKASNEKLPAADDFIFKGVTSKWIKVAYVLKARFALRLTAVDGSQVASQKALDYISKADMKSSEENANTYFQGSANSLNQWYALNVSRANYLTVGKYFVDYLQTTNDPRLSYMIAKNISPNGSSAVAAYIGNSAEDQLSTGASYIGSKYASANSSIGIVTYEEAKFIEAEAKTRLGQAGAQTALQEAVKASVTTVTGSAPSSAFLTTATATFDVASIIQQKYIALFLTMEPYNDYRRTGFPKLVPNQNSNTKLIPVRLPTPANERQYNSNATVVSNVTSKIWWDKD